MFQRKRHLDQLRNLTEVSVAGRGGQYLPFYGLLFGVFNHALEQGFVTVNPCQRIAPKRSRIRQFQAALRFLTEAEFARVADAARGNADMIAVTLTVGIGMRFGEVTALWVSDMDAPPHPAHRQSLEA